MAVANLFPQSVAGQQPSMLSTSSAVMAKLLSQRRTSVSPSAQPSLARAWVRAYHKRSVPCFHQHGLVEPAGPHWQDNQSRATIRTLGRVTLPVVAGPASSSKKPKGGPRNGGDSIPVLTALLTTPGD